MTPERRAQILINLAIQGQIDPEIRPLVEAMNRDGCTTTGSCCGHGKEDAYVSLVVCDLAAIRALFYRVAELNLFFSGKGVWFDLTAQCDYEVATTSEPLENEFAFDLSIFSDRDNSWPTTLELKRVAKRWGMIQLPPEAK